jgi:hypothetical protein
MHRVPGEEMEDKFPVELLRVLARKHEIPVEEEANVDYR